MYVPLGVEYLFRPLVSIPLIIEKTLMQLLIDVGGRKGGERRMYSKHIIHTSGFQIPDIRPEAAMFSDKTHYCEGD